jgi:hypothetical protein
MSTTTDFWVNDIRCEPLFLITAEVNDSLLSMVDGQIIPYMKELSAGRRVTFIFDREGWSPKCFTRWFNEGVDAISVEIGCVQAKTRCNCCRETPSLSAASLTDSPRF